MATLILKKGLETNRLSTTPAIGELIYTTDLKKCFLGDGSTAGGVSVNETANELLIKIITVDGSGSGLDVDTVDGIEGSQLIRNDQDGTLVGSLTLDDTLYSSISNLVNANTIVDMKIYDTTKDSDGGAWRKKTAHTSWYNETLNTATRGSTKEFPVVVMIVAAYNKTTIYDATDSAYPMWMVFGIGDYIDFPAVTSIDMFNGMLVSGSNYINSNGIFRQIDFIKDLNYQRRSNGISIKDTGHTIVDRNVEGTSNILLDNSASVSIVDDRINDVSITVLSDAQIDSETGLPIPTIAVGTANGMNVVQNIGKVIDFNSVNFSDVVINNDGSIIASGLAGTYFTWLIDNVALNGFTTFVFDESSIPRRLGDGISTGIGGASVKTKLGKVISTQSSGLHHLKIDETDAANGMVNYISNDYQSGWQKGDIKGAFLSSTDSANLVGSGELVTNGTFDSNITGWASSGVRPATVSWDAGEIKVSYLATQFGSAFATFSTIIGQSYILTGTATSSVSSSAWIIKADSDDFAINRVDAVSGVVTPSTGTVTFVATATTTYVHVLTNDTSSSVNYDNISVKLADTDRSYNNNGLSVLGTVTRSAVETGAELMAYSGFSSVNYLEQPHNSDLDFGTGDFYAMGWVKFGNNATSETPLSIQNHENQTDYFLIQKQPDNTLRAQIDSSIAAAFAFATDIGNEWRFVAGTVVGDIISIYIDGELIDSATRLVADDSFDYTDGNLYIGVYDPSQSDYRPMLGDLALWRVGGGSPSDTQLLEIYESERHLFEENAACTLNQTTNSNIADLSYDEDTNLTYVAGTDNLDVFQDLVRVDSIAGTFTSVDASNDIIMKGN